MRSTKRPNLWAIGVIAFCFGAWGFSIFAMAKTTHLYTHRSPAGFRHDVVEHAREHWVELKKAVISPPEPPAKPASEHI